MLANYGWNKRVYRARQASWVLVGVDAVAISTLPSWAIIHRYKSQLWSVLGRAKPEPRHYCLPVLPGARDYPHTVQSSSHPGK